MEIVEGAILEGTVSSITKYGAFVSLPGGRAGLVHISEIANTYVSDVNDHLTVGQTVKVLVLGIDENRRINLSIKRALPKTPRREYSGRRDGQGDRNRQGSREYSSDQRPRREEPKTPPTFEDKLKQFMAESDSRLSGRYEKARVRRNGGGRRGS